MIRSNFCDYSDPYILFKGTIPINGLRADDTSKLADDRNKGAIFKNWTPITDCISEYDNTQIDKAKDIDDVMSMCKLIENRNNYSKPS